MAVRATSLLVLLVGLMWVGVSSANRPDYAPLESLGDLEGGDDVIDSEGRYDSGVERGAFSPLDEEDEYVYTDDEDLRRESRVAQFSSSAGCKESSEGDDDYYYAGESEQATRVLSRRPGPLLKGRPPTRGALKALLGVPIGGGGPVAKVGCFKRSYGRGVGAIRLSCKWMPGSNKDGGLCYKKCGKGYKAVGPVCWKFPKSHGRGVGKPMKPFCNPDEELDAGLCYRKCDSGTKGIGPVCWGHCQGQYPEDCGAFCAASGKCGYVTGRMGKQVFSAILTLFKAGKCLLTGPVAPLCLAGVAQKGAQTGLDMKKFFKDEMDGVCR